MRDKIEALLKDVKDGKIDISKGVEYLKDLPFQDIGHTKIDHHRSLRNGFPEVIYGESKTPSQIRDIFLHLGKISNVLGTRISEEAAELVISSLGDVKYNKTAKTLTYVKDEIKFQNGEIVIVTAGTSDLPCAEEAKVTCEMFGSRANIISDVGVAGIHRLFDRLDEIRRASVIIVVAGMEGALPSVIGGLVDKPLIAVPTSVGYGANFSGISALLGMLTSCASGISVVNIDNGFGAAYAACRINRLIESK